MATSVRITSTASVLLSSLAGRTGKSKAQIVEEALRDLEDRLFWTEVRQAFAGGSRIGRASCRDGALGVNRSRRIQSSSRMKRGEIYWCDLEPKRGREQGARRPVVIISADPYNQSQSPLIGVVPLTTAVAKRTRSTSSSRKRRRALKPIRQPLSTTPVSSIAPAWPRTPPAGCSPPHSPAWNAI